jgi:hypothetical protein
MAEGIHNGLEKSGLRASFEGLRQRRISEMLFLKVDMVRLQLQLQLQLLRDEHS